jgi:hypothetical protein
MPSDITIRRNFFYSPEIWNKHSPKFIPVGNPPTNWQKKNLIEFKHARRVLLEANVFDGSWQDGQVGYAMTIKSAGHKQVDDPAVTEHLTIRYNLIRNSAAPFSLSGAEGGTTRQTNHVLIEHNLAYDQSVAPFIGESKQILWQHAIYDIYVRNNTLIAPGGSNSALTALGNGGNAEFSGNVMMQGSYGYNCSMSGGGFGTDALYKCFSSLAFRNNALIGDSPKWSYGPEVTFVRSLNEAFVNPAAKDFRINANGPLAGKGAGADVTRILQMTQGVD